MSLFDFSSVEESSGEFDLIKNGVYQAVAEKAEWKQAKSNPQNEYLNVQYRLTDSNRVIFGLYNLINQNAVASNIAMSAMKSLLIATGSDADKAKEVSKEDLIDLILDKPFMAKVGMQKGSGDFPDKNVVKDYLPLDEKNTPFVTNESSPF